MTMRETLTPNSSAVDNALQAIARDTGKTSELKSDRLVAAFERQILSGRLAPGTLLPTETGLCESLGVSRSVVRDSVRTLSARGLVTVRQGRGTTVAEPDDAAFTNALLILLSRSGLSMGEVMKARATIETGLVRLAADAGVDDDWEELATILDTFDHAVRQGDDTAAASAHTNFHHKILEAVRQPALSLLLKPMNELTLVSGTASVRRSTSEDWEVEAHRPILHALQARDPDAAEQAVIEHYEVAMRPMPYQAFLERRFSDAYFNGE